MRARGTACADRSRTPSPSRKPYRPGPAGVRSHAVLRRYKIYQKLFQTQNPPPSADGGELVRTLKILFQRYLPTSCFYLLLECFGVFFLHAVLQLRRSGLDESLRFCKAKVQCLLNRLDDSYLLVSDRRELNVEFRLFLGSCSSRPSGDGNSRCRDAPLLLDGLHERVELENGHLLNCFDDLFLCHSNF